MKKIVYVIGDRFSSFTGIEGAVHYSDWCIIRTGPLLREALYIPGQGLTTEQAFAVLETALIVASQEGWKLDWPTLQLASRQRTHKSRPENVIITEPVMTAEKIFESSLVLQRDNELLLDHTTGFHIQGMVFLEATRQVATAVVDIIYYNSDKYYVMHDIHADYLSFAFPIETKIILQLHELGVNDEGNESFAVHLDFIQNGRKVVTTAGSFTAIERSLMLDREQRLAQMTLQKGCRGLQKRLHPLTEGIDA